LSMAIIRITILLLVFINASPVYADNASGSDYLKSCNLWLEPYSNFQKMSDSERLEVSRCKGALDILLFLGLGQTAGMCIPNGVYYDQLARVITTYLNKNPEKLHHPFSFLALEAIQAAWPCDKK